jgi:hypothetical protein
VAAPSRRSESLTPGADRGCRYSVTRPAIMMIRHMINYVTVNWQLMLQKCTSN